MINFELFSKIKHYREQRALTPDSDRQELQLDPRTVAKWLAEHRSCPGNPQNVPANSTPSKAHPADAGDPSLLRHPDLQRIREEGFEGGYTIIKDYMRKVRPGADLPSSNWRFSQWCAPRSDWGLLWHHCRR